jgi:transcriptional antiterminator NusG
MQYFVVLVGTAREDEFVKRVEQQFLKTNRSERLFFPKRKLTIRRQGKILDEVKPLFPGYVFLEAELMSTETRIDPVLFDLMRRTRYFYRFLNTNSDITPLAGRDLAFIEHFLSFGKVAEASKVYFDENDRICVVAGPLKGLEGYIIKVDKRKKRAKVRLEMVGQDFLLDLAFESLERNSAPQVPQEEAPQYEEDEI